MGKGQRICNILSQVSRKKLDVRGKDYAERGEKNDKVNVVK